jgi:hypothetical protein
MRIKITPTEAYGWGKGDFNYSAIDSDTYDGASSLIGYGPTPKAALTALAEEIAAFADHVAADWERDRKPVRTGNDYCPANEWDSLALAIQKLADKRNED